MGMSVNTNEGALLALQTLNVTNKALNTVQSRINTGLKVASAKDNGAVFAISQKLRADVAGLSAAKDSLDRATSTLDVALAAGQAIGDLLIEMKAKAAAAADPGLDQSSRDALNEDFKQLRDQVTTIVDDAEFNGINAVKSGGDQIVAIINSDASSTITAAPSDMSLGGITVTVTATTEIGGADETAAAAAIALVEASITNLSTDMAKLGSASKRFSLQKDFVTKLSDTIEVGIGNLVDADMAKESANLQSLQVKQQLGLQALSIANQAPGAVMSLFRG